MSRKLTFDLIFNEMNVKNISGLIALNIKGKNINDISILSQIPSLEIISLSNNDINNLAVFKTLKNLKKLSLKGNKINDFNQIENLRYCPKLEYLKLKDNPISKEKNYLSTILKMLPSLKIFDDAEVNKININENSNIKADIKKVEGINNESKFIKLKPTKIKNNFNTYNPNPFIGSPKKLANPKLNNNIINYPNEKEPSKEKNIAKNDQKEINNNLDKKEEKEKPEKKTNNIDEDDDFEIININDEKKKMEKENKKYQKIEPKVKADIYGYSFKKKSSTGFFFYDPKKRKQQKRTESNLTLGNRNSSNDFFNSFNEENKNMVYNYSTSKYSRKIIGRIHGNSNVLSQSIRYDNDEEDNNKNGIYSRKSKLGALKSRLLNNITNKIYNKSKKTSINDKEIEKEKTIIKSIKLLLTNLDEEELNQVNNNLNTIIEKRSKQ